MSDELRGLDNWIMGTHITDDPRSPYYTGPEDDEAILEAEDEAWMEANYGETERDWDDIRDGWE